MAVQQSTVNLQRAVQEPTRAERKARKKHDKSLRKQAALAKIAKVAQAAGSPNCPSAGEYRSMWCLPKDMTYQDVADHLGIGVHLLLEENPFGDGYNGPETELSKGTIVFVAVMAVCRFILCLARA